MKYFIVISSPTPSDMSSSLMLSLLPSIIFTTLLLLSSSLLQCTTAIPASTPINVDHNDVHALLALKNGFQFPEPALSSWNNNHSTNSPSSSIIHNICSSWTGIRCLDNRVISLDLTDFNLCGSISPAIYELDRLIHLSLAGNNLTGNLQLFNLSTHLRYLNISDNQFSGSLELNGSFPDLEVFDAYDNNFTDSLPVNGLLELRKLKHLDLGGNYFYGGIPAEYGMLSDELEYLSLQGNDLRGKIPRELGNLTSLKELYLGYYNSWEGGIPAELGSLVNLVLLDISNCELLDGVIPPQLGNLNLLRTLFLHINLLSGPIPKELGNLTGLINLDLSNNALTGEIPSELSNLKKLKLFNLFMNKLHGSIPDYVAREFVDLEVLQLWKNNFTGMIPQDLGRKDKGKLEFVDLSSNKLTGTIPSGLCDSKVLKVLILLRNFLFGPIPEGLGRCFSLVRVRLGENYLNGSIPDGLIYLPQLNLLELQDNDLTGSLAENPSPGTYYNAAATQQSVLVQLDLSDNHLSGPLPSSISNLSSLQFLLLAGNQFSGPIPSSSLGKLDQVVKIDLSQNNISGLIPPDMGSCTHLTYLDLSQNNLSGVIPPHISRMHILNYLNLSRNHLDGGIPDSIGFMKSLTNADFSFNDLSGELPDKGQLSVFNASSFAGNSQLCGALINNPCNLSTLMPDGRGAGRKAGNTGEFKLIFALGFLICSLVFTVAAVMKAKSLKKGVTGSGGSWKMTTFGKVEFRVSDVLECMKDGNVIGRGGAGIVYRGKLPNGMEIAVKKLLSCGPNPSSSSHDDHGFRAEIQTLGNIRHRNIVRLLAFCSNRQTNLLVFEYMRNGSLGEALHNGKLLMNKGGLFLGWNLRYKIAIEAAKGLCYLHHDCSPLIVHRDVKSNNILLDSNFEAHVADFGLAKFLVDGGGASQCMSAVAGSYGYIAPEYAYTLRVDEKSDVYSFGVVLLELLTGRRPVGDFGEGVDIVQWSKNKTKCRKEDVCCIIDQRLIAHVPQDEAMHFFFIAMLCVQDNSVERPTMRDVVQMLTEFQDQHQQQHNKVQDHHHQSPSSSAVLNKKSDYSIKDEKEQQRELNSRDHLLV